MDRFDLKTSPRSDFTEAPPPGYQVGCVRIGELDESIFFSTEIWSPADYTEHWKAIAQLLLQGETGLFCTDLTEQNASIFIGFPQDTGFEFEEWGVPRQDLELEGVVLKIGSVERIAAASRWRVTAEAVRAFASS